MQHCSIMKAVVYKEPFKVAVEDVLDQKYSMLTMQPNYEHNAILRRSPDRKWETVTHDPRLLWPDTLSLAADGYLYVMANQLHRQARFHKGHDLRQKPYTLFRVHVDAQPVLLRR